MKLVLISLFWLLLLRNEATPSSVIKVLPYPPAVDGRSKPTQLISTSTGFIAAHDRSLIYISEDSDILSYSGVIRPGSLQSGVAAKDFSCILYCFQDGHCSLVVDQQEIRRFEAAVTPDVAISMSVVGDSFYIASSAEEEQKIRISQYNTKVKYFLQEPLVFAGKITNKNFISREFFFNFYDDVYVYFIAIDTFKTPTNPHEVERAIRLMRTCHPGDNGTDFSSMFEIELDCGPLNPNASIISFSRLNHTVLLGLGGAGGSEKFCMFTTTNIDSVITRTYQLCYSGNFTSELAWVETRYPCTEFHEVSGCENERCIVTNSICIFRRLLYRNVILEKQIPYMQFVMVFLQGQLQ